MNSLTLPRRAANKLLRSTHRIIDGRRRRAIYERYRDASMIPRQAYLDNLAIASRAARDPALFTGCVVECGTWRGGMSAALREVMGAHRIYHFFDSFSGLPPAKEIDGKSALRWQADKTAPTYFDNCTASEEEFRSVLARAGKSLSNCKIHKGLFADTVPTSETGPIAILRIDGDWYDSTMTCLETMFSRILPGGIVIIDDYGTWDGCTRALHDFLSAHKRPEAIERFGRSAVPYLRIRQN
jgi:O-methyltransferase